MARFWKRLNLFARAQEKSALNSLHSVSEMQGILERQRSLADRHGHKFSLVVFCQRNPQGRDSDVCRLASVLLSRCRSTDEVGWLDENRIGVVLQFTLGDDAWRLADDVCKTMTETSIPPNCTVFTYPSDWFRSDGPRERQLGFGDAVPQFDPAPFLGSSESAGPDSDVAMVALVESATCRRIVSSRPIQPLEALFVRPLPRWKRAMDIVGSIAGMIFFSPIMLAVTTAITLTSKGPVFFAQERTGQGYRRFKMYKFRTMVDGADKQIARIKQMNEMTGPLIKMNKDPRLTKVGQILRRTSLDELPQLFNVLKGDMAIIGPRALSPLPSEYESWQLRRFAVKPGIACTWQAERRADTEFENWMRSDLRYVQSTSFWTDICVLVKTLLTVVSCKGSR